jgi:nicotinate-nucleotide pyrophosphorylase (carboxylating)
MSADRELRELVERSLSEDLGAGDVTAGATVPDDAGATARLYQKAPGVLFGLDVAEEVFRQAGADNFERDVVEGQWRDDVPALVATVTGRARDLLAAERTALNFLARLSGVATLAARFVEAVDGTGVTILDTRKTTPGLRTLEKAAVAAGGGRNHRMGLHDAILIKENHAALAGGVAAAVERSREAHPQLPIEVECRDLDEVRDALAASADRLLLDNMDVADLRAAVAMRDEDGGSGLPPAKLEASGGVTLDSVRAIAESGVEYISVGALTHSAPALDVSMLVEPS